MEKIREIVYYKEYFKEFYFDQTRKVQEKIDLGLYYLQYTKQIPGRFVGSTDERNLFYLRIKRGNDIFRIFFCYDEGNLVILMNGYTKKTQKIPKTEIDKAIKIKKQYFNEKTT